MEHVILRLQRKFPQISLEAIRLEVADAYRDVGQSRVGTFVPILVERQVTERFTDHPVAS